MEINIRPYEDTDVEMLLEVWYEATRVAHTFMEEAFLAKERENIVHIYLPNTETWVIEEGDKLLGFISMLGNEVGAIFVQPQWHGKGLGQQLMDHVAQLHPTLEVEVFEVNQIGRKFYDRYGFRTIEKKVHEETGQPLLRMRYPA